MFSLSQVAGEGKPQAKRKLHLAYNPFTMLTKAVCLGDACIDHYLPPIQRDFIGGNALNVAIHMQRAGLPAAFVGAVSNDRYGELILQALRQEKVDISHVQRSTASSRQANIQLTAGNEHVFIHGQPAPIPRLALDDRTLGFIRQHQLVHTGWLGGAQEQLPAIQQAKLLLSIDYGEGQNAGFHRGNELPGRPGFLLVAAGYGSTGAPPG